jgi:curved DNA-binding protein CbpA
LKNYYAILQLYFGATPVEIKQAFHKLAIKYHPDKNNGSLFFEEKFKEINEAYSVLSDERKRALYIIEYNIFLYPKKEIKTTPTSFTRNNIFDINAIPKQPLGQATRSEINYLGLILSLIGFIFVIIFILILNSNQLKKSENNINLETGFNYQPIKDKMSDAELEQLFYQSINTDANKMNDSTLLKLNLDSLKIVFDSIMKGYYD